jgi:hypothetical protein
MAIIFTYEIALPESSVIMSVLFDPARGDDVQPRALLVVMAARARKVSRLRR